MDCRFWLARWREGKLGFHQEEINPYLQRFWPSLQVPAANSVFVPLCGKSHDLLWLHQQGHPVVGVEISELAVRSFFTEQGLCFTREKRGTFTRFYAHDVELLCGDFFDLRPPELAGVTAVYYRAALIALPPQMRQYYVAHLYNFLLPGKVSALLVTLEYPPNEMEGPPFSVTEKEVRKLFQPEFRIELLEEQDILETTPFFREQGLTALNEKAFRLIRPASNTR